jgi:hypothetical protein
MMFLDSRKIVTMRKQGTNIEDGTDDRKIWDCCKIAYCERHLDGDDR